MPGELFAIIVLPLLLGLANNGGIGGGGFIVPFCIAFNGFNTLDAMAQSNFVIFCGAVVRYVFFSVRLKHPNAENRTIIDYNIVSVMIPLVLVGALFGTVIASVLPDAVLTILLICLLCYLLFDSCKKSIKMWKAETKKK